MRTAEGCQSSRRVCFTREATWKGGTGRVRERRGRGEGDNGADQLTYIYGAIKSSLDALLNIHINQFIVKFDNQTHFNLPWSLCSRSKSSIPPGLRLSFCASASVLGTETSLGRKRKDEEGRGGRGRKRKEEEGTAKKEEQE